MGPIAPDLTVNYQDSAGNWCPLISNGGQNYYFSGFGTPPCGTETTAFSLAPGQSLTLNLQVSIAYDPTNGTGPGPQAGQGDPLERELH